MKYKSFKEYLLVNGLTGKLSAEQITTLKAKWRKAYQKAYHQKYGKKRIRKTITLNTTEEIQLETAAIKHHIPLNKFIKQCLFAYLNKTYVVVAPEKVQSLEMQVRKIGGLVNQIARYANMQRKIAPEEVEGLYSLLYQMEDQVNEALYNPVDIEGVIQRELEENPKFINNLEALVVKYKNKGR